MPRKKIPRLDLKKDPGHQEFERAKKQARESRPVIHRRGHQLYREPKE